MCFYKLLMVGIKLLWYFDSADYILKEAYNTFIFEMPIFTTL